MSLATWLGFAVKNLGKFVSGEKINFSDLLKDIGALKPENKEDEAFYMEQMVEWLQSGKPLPTSEEQVIKALGVWQLKVVLLGGYVVSTHPRFARSAVAQRQKI